MHCVKVTFFFSCCLIAEYCDPHSNSPGEQGHYHSTPRCSAGELRTMMKAVIFHHAILLPPDGKSSKGCFSFINCNGFYVNYFLYFSLINCEKRKLRKKLR